MAYLVRLAELIAEHHSLELRYVLVHSEEHGPTLFDDPAARPEPGAGQAPARLVKLGDVPTCDACGASMAFATTSPERCQACGAEVLA